MANQDAEETLIEVEVAYATPARQLIIKLQVPLGTTAYEAVLLSKISETFGDIDPDHAPMGIFSRRLDGKTRPLPQEYTLQSRDRVEIYRPLLIDPKEARLLRASKVKKKAQEPGKI